MFHNTNVLITGGTGSWGYELVRQLLTHEPRRIIVFSRNEKAQVEMNRELSDGRVEFRIGDIRDSQAIMEVCENIDYVFHLAALKHVTICEDQPNEALKTNVIGTQNVIEAAVENNVKMVINVSTDKAADPSNFYGMTKAIGEKLMVYANLRYAQTRFICVRGGNVLGSNGSVLQLFVRQLRERKPLGITDKKMTRFFMTVQEATELLLQAAAIGVGGETFVMAMPACRIMDLAEILHEEFGEGSPLAWNELGIRPGEKLHEILMSEYESEHAYYFDDKYIVIFPPIEFPDLKGHYAGCPSAAVRTYSSHEQLIPKEEIRKMLARGGFLS
ncbi:SDR family NAD(P)-dependent oxidoreductase [Cohnella silvisoli]|uniref:SDR family NAD(P)-dependent oxidoreductase n=1 Tax=Cohnella silvisoli TaxID=2873699 RepID=A0ABV1L225_9BACL|nr:SDR family NAD(P)-dependent oxidoreductase [Cohnella silvisoli]MCD9026467.1 polysaccharide biosynthesis protein [Cohnella silvisoli]